MRPEDFERAAVLVPPDMLLREFHATVEPMLRLLAKLSEQNDRLNNARDVLLPRLMNGEIAV